jgi:hypothetical protein
VHGHSRTRIQIAAETGWAAVVGTPSKAINATFLLFGVADKVIHRKETGGPPNDFTHYLSVYVPGIHVLG